MAQVHKKALLLVPQIRIWGASTKSERSREAAATATGASKEMITASKKLLHPAVLSGIKGAAWTARRTIYQSTLPWDDQGKRLLPAVSFDKVRRTLAKCKDTFDKEVKKLVTNFDNEINRAASQLDQDFDRSDYPSANEVSTLFSMHFVYEPIPQSEDIRIEMSDDIRVEIEKEYAAAVQERLANGVETMFDRLSEVLSDYRDSIGNVDKSYHRSTLEKVGSLLEALPAFNIVGDERINDLIRKVKEKLPLDDSELRGDKEVRQVAANTAGDLLGALDMVRSTGKEED